MKKGILINYIELGYAPMSAYTFKQLIRDKQFSKNVIDSHLYIIAQRRELTFNNFYFPSPKEVRFEIMQENADNIIKCALPLFQKNIATDTTKSVEMRLQNRKNTLEKKAEPPYNGTQRIIFKETDEKKNESRRLLWLTPEKLLHHHWKGNIEVELTGDYREMLKYKVHYVGKSTEQNICNRLSNHSTFQEILISEDTLAYGNIPSNEIVILLLRIKDNNTIVTWDSDSSDEEVVEYLSNYLLPNDRTVSLDAEKALIKHLQPEYNKILYNSYPNENDLLSKDFHDVILYCFTDPITLVYQNGLIGGSQNLDERDYISVKKKD